MSEKACTGYEVCRDSPTASFIFLIGLIATIAIRLVTLLADVDLFYGKVAWYIGVGGFVAFFFYKFQIRQRRLRYVNRSGLMNRIVRKEKIEDGDYEFMVEILCDLNSPKERMNYFLIFALSAVAVGMAAYFDFFAI